MLCFIFTGTSSSSHAGTCTQPNASKLLKGDGESRTPSIYDNMSALTL